MKKILAIALTIVMMFAVCIPAFAVNPVTNDTVEKSDSPKVYTTTDNISGDGTYSVSFPADMPVVWGEEKTDFEYSITSQLLAGKRVAVAVAADNAVMTLAGGTDTLAYTVTGDGVGTAVQAADEVVNAEAHNISVNVATTDWSAAAIGTYEDTVTFTVSIVDAA